MAAKFEKASHSPGLQETLNKPSTEDQVYATFGSVRSVSCPADGGGSRKVSLNGSPGTGDVVAGNAPFMGENDHAGATERERPKVEQADEQAWESLTNALGNMHPEDLTILQELLSEQPGRRPQSEETSGTSSRIGRSSGWREKSGAGGRPDGGPRDR